MCCTKDRTQALPLLSYTQLHSTLSRQLVLSSACFQNARTAALSSACFQNTRTATKDAQEASVASLAYSVLGVVTEMHVFSSLHLETKADGFL